MLYPSVAISEKAQDLLFVAVSVGKIGHTVVGIGNYKQSLFRGAGFIIFKRHFHGDKMITAAVDKQYGNAAFFHGVNSGVAVRVKIKLLFANAPDHSCSQRIVGQMQIFARHVLPNSGRRGKAAIGNNANHI